MTSPIASLGNTPPKPPHRITSRPQPDPPYHDPDLDITFALAIITAYTPPPTPSLDYPSISNSSGPSSRSGSVSSTSPFCTHTFVTRHKIPHSFRCPSCHAAHQIGWHLCCESCGLSGCGECRGYWVERTFGALDGVLIQAKNRPALRRGSLVSDGSSTMTATTASIATTMTVETVGTAETETTTAGSTAGKVNGEDGVRRTLEEKRAWYTPDEIDEGFEIDVELVKMLV